MIRYSSIGKCGRDKCRTRPIRRSFRILYGEPLEDRRLLASFLDNLSQCWDLRFDDDLLVHLGDGTPAKAYFNVSVDLANPLLGGVFGTLLAAPTGPGALLGGAVGIVASELLDISLNVSVDLHDILGKTTDANNGNWVTVYVSLFEGASFALGLADIVPLTLGFAYVPSPSVNFDRPAFTGTQGGEIKGALIPGRTGTGCEANTNLFDVQIGGVQFELAAEVRLDAVVDVLPDILANNVITQLNGVRKLLSGTLSGKYVRGLTPDDGAEGTPGRAITIGERTAGLVDSSRPVQSYPLDTGQTANLSITTQDVGGSHPPLLQLTTPDGNVYYGTDGRLGIPMVPAGRSLLTAAASDSSQQAFVLAFAQPQVLDDDVAALPVRPRVFHDSAGHSFDAARLVSLDRSNKGDDAGQISPQDDLDFYKFVTPAAGVIDVDVQAGAGLVTIAGLYDAQRDANGDGKPDKVDTDASDNDGVSHFRYPVQAGGTYFVGIESKDHATTGSYELHVRPYDEDDAPGGSGTDTQPQPTTWGSRVAGPHINLVGGAGSSRGSIAEPGETDWFQINGTQAGNMVVTVAGTNDDLQDFVTAYRVDGGGIDSDTGERDGTAEVRFTVTAGELIVVAVRSHERRTTGGYTITVTQPSTMPDDDYPDFGESPAAFGPLAVGDGYMVGRIETADDSDWFQIPVAGDGYLHIQATTTDGGLVPLLEVSNNGPSGFFDSDDGEDGRAHVAFLPSTAAVWAKVTSRNGAVGEYHLEVWRNLYPEDDHPNSGGPYTPPWTILSGGTVELTGRIEIPTDKDSFRVLAEHAGPVAIEVISLTPGFTPFVKASWQTPNLAGTSDTDGGSGRGGRAFFLIDNVLAAPHNWIYLDVMGNDPHDGSDAEDYGDFVVYIWQPAGGDAANRDYDPDTVGIEASPILLDGRGHGSLPGSPNGAEPAPALNFAGDRDIFQVTAASSRPMTFTVEGRDAFLRVYDPSGHAIATDHGSGPSGSSQVTLEADAGQLFYLEVTAYNGTDTGNYTVRVSQSADDHPDQPLFVPRESQIRDATPLAFDAAGLAQATGQIEDALVGDRDVFQATSARRAQWTIDVETTDARLDTLVRVYDSFGSLVATDDDGGEGRNSRIVLTTCMNETYQIEVSGYGDSSVGSYRLTVRQTDLPEPVRVGSYDDFDDNRIDGEKWTSSAAGSARVREDGGRLQLLADGANATGDNNAAAVESRIALRENIEFDVTPRLGIDQNYAYVELANASASIRLRFGSDGAGGVRVTVENSGYTELENAGALPISEDAVAHVAFRNASRGVEVYVNGSLRARFQGSLPPDSVLRAHAASVQSASRLQLTPYDDFNDNSIDGAKWNASGGVRETNGKLVLYATEGSQGRVQSATTEGKVGGVNIHGAKWSQAYLDGAADNMDHWCEITNGTDYIRFFYKSTGPTILVQLGGVYGSGEVAKLNTAGTVVEVKEESGDLTIRLNNELKYTMSGKQLAANSYFRAVARYNGSNPSGYGDKRMTVDELAFYQLVTTAADERFAELNLDNVQAQYRPRYDWLPTLYDDFQDGRLDRERWNMAGRIEAADGLLKLPLFRAGQAVAGFVSTADMPGGTNLRGFTVNVDRTSGPKLVGATSGHEFDTWARMRLTTGQDWIEVGWNLQNNTFKVETHGSYGSRTEEFPVPADQIVDGGFTVREFNGNIEVLHDGTVKLTLPGMTVRAGSYFTFEANGNPENRGDLRDAPTDFDVKIDNLTFFVEPVRPEFHAGPSLKKESDSGDSDADHITNQLSLDFEWTAAAAGTRYQWREGELQEDGTIAYGVWSPPQSDTSAHVELPHGSIHVIAVRPLDAAGLVGEASARAMTVDTEPPVLLAAKTVAGAAPRLELQFSESVSGEASDLTILDANGNALVPVTVSGWGTPDLTVEFGDPIWAGTATVRVNGSQSVKDIAGNRLDGNEDGTAGGDAVRSVAFVVDYWTNPVNALDVNITNGVSPLDVLEVINYINSHPGLAGLPAVQFSPPRFYDANADGAITPQDVIVIINFLNSQSVGGEGEASFEAAWSIHWEQGSPPSRASRFQPLGETPEQAMAPRALDATWPQVAKPAGSGAVAASPAPDAAAAEILWDELDEALEEIAEWVSHQWLAPGLAG